MMLDAGMPWERVVGRKEPLKDTEMETLVLLEVEGGVSGWQ